MGLSAACPGCGKDLAVIVGELQPQLCDDGTPPVVGVALTVEPADVAKHAACLPTRTPAEAIQ